MYCQCLRANGTITENECCSLVLATDSAADLAVCLGCSRGQRLAALSPWQPGASAHDGVSAVLQDVLGYVIARYPKSKTQGLRFLALVAEGRYAFRGGAALLEKAAEDAGLDVVRKQGRPVLLINTAARKLANAM